MKVLLVRPPRIKQAVTLGEFMYSEPIGLEIVYAMLEENHEVEILDLMTENIEIEEKLKHYQPQVVGLTTLCIDVPTVIHLAKRIKDYDPTLITLVGGTQTFLNSQSFFIETIDHVMKYTTRKNIEDLFSYLQKGENPPLIDGISSRINGFQTTAQEGINEYIPPNRKATAKYRSEYSYFGYKPAAIMGTAQGCSKGCHFCLRWRLEGYGERYFPMEAVQEEIRSIQEETIMIYDNDFLHSRERLKELCDFLEKEKIEKNFICYASVNSILKNKESIQRFKKLGLKAVLVGYETFKEEELEEYKKKTSIEESQEASQFLKKIQVDVWASFMLHPDWDKEDFHRFRRYIKKLNPEISTFSPLTPFPNLPLYGEYKKRLLFSKEDYERWSFGQVTIAPSKMSLRRYYYEILKTHFYVNLFQNNIAYLIRKFGFSTLIRLGRGTSNSFWKYMVLIIKN